MNVLKFLVLVTFLFGLVAEAVSAATPGHDHHVIESEAVDQIDGVETGDAPVIPNNNENSEHGRHALHGCGVCHHAVGFTITIISPFQKLLPVRFKRLDDRLISQIPEPPYNPPIGVSA